MRQPGEEHSTPNEKFDYFIKRTERDLDYIRDKVDDLMSFRWMLIGSSTVISAVITLGLNVWLRTRGG